MSLNPAFKGYSQEFQEARLAIILDQYSAALTKIRAILADAESRDKSNTIARTKSLIAQVEREIQTEINKGLDKWSEKTIKEIYKQGYKIGADTAEYYDIGNSDFSSLTNQLNVQSTQILVDQITRDIQLINGQIEDQVKRYLSLSSQQFYTDIEISKNILQGELQGLSGAQTGNLVLDTLKKGIVSGNLINVAGRLWNINDYVSLIVRTRTSEASSRGTLNAAIDYGMDLIQIDIHGDACPLCMTKMGRVYSISGNNPDFPRLESFTPFHANCRCHMFPITELALRERGRYDALSSFSKNTPYFAKASDARDWLKSNPQYAVINQNDMDNVYRGVL